MHITVGTLCGLAGAVIGGLILDYTKLFKEVAVVCMGSAILCLIWFAEVGLQELYVEQDTVI